MSNHPWCSDPSRDEAVRAAEDGRQGPLPTLDEAIATARAMMPKSGSGSSEVIALRARVAELENAAKLAPAANAGGVSDPEQISDDGKTNRQGKLDSSSEPVAWGVLIDSGRGLYGHYDFESEARGVCDAVNADEGFSLSVVPLYAAPVAKSATTPQPPRGWLTDEERLAIGEGVYVLANSGYYGARAKAELLRSLLARSTPPRVKVPKYFPMSWAHERDDAWIVAIREAGGEVE